MFVGAFASVGRNTLRSSSIQISHEGGDSLDILPVLVVEREAVHLCPAVNGTLIAEISRMRHA